MKRSSKVRQRVGDVVAIPVQSQYAFGRILNDCGLAVYSVLASSQDMPAELADSQVLFHTAFVPTAVDSGEWPIVGHVNARHPDDDWEPPKLIPNILNPKRPSIQYRGERRPATPEEVIGLERGGMRMPHHVIEEIGVRLLGRPRSQLPSPMKKLTSESGAFENDDAFEVLSLLARARGWSSLKKWLAKANCQGYLEAPPAKLAVAAAEVVTAGCGQPVANLPDVVPTFLARVGAPEPELLDSARSAVSRILENSELRELWEESKHFADWQAAMNDLTMRLARCTVAAK